jgi:ABC-2 type transport system permease protein
VGLAPAAPLITQIAEFCLGVTGVLAATTEQADGSLRLTFIATPRRARVIRAKAMAVGGLAMVAGLVAVYGTHAITQAIAGGRYIRVFSEPNFQTTGVLVAYAVTVPAMALTALGLGLWLRSTAGAITLLAVSLFVVPILAQAVPGPVGLWVRAVELDALAGQLAGVGNPHSVFTSMLSPAGALAVMIAYPAALLGAGAWAVLRRDA